MSLRTDSGLDLNRNVLFDLDNNIAVDSLSLVDGFVQLKYYIDLCFVAHGEDEPSGNVLVIDHIVESQPMEAQVFGVEVDGILASRHCKVDVKQGS